MTRLVAGATLAALLATALATAPAAQSQPLSSACERLATLALPDTTIDRAEAVSGPAFSKAAVYNGQGSTDRAENFTCRERGR